MRRMRMTKIKMNYVLKHNDAHAGRATQAAYRIMLEREKNNIIWECSKKICSEYFNRIFSLYGTILKLEEQAQ